MSEPPKYINWGCCTEEENGDSDYVVCGMCDKGFHLACLASSCTGRKTTRDQIASPNWVCPLCSTKPKGGNNDNTPLRSQCSNAPTRGPKRVALNSPPQVHTSLTRKDVGEVVQDILQKEMENLFLRLGQQIRSAIAAELAPIRKEISELKASVIAVNEQCDAVTMRQNNIVEETHEIHIEKASLRSENIILTAKINQLEQYARGKNVEIQCVPEKNNENVISIVLNICNTINCDIKEDQIMSCSRIAKLKPQSTRPRSIVVQFNSPRVRDTFLAANIKFNKANPTNKLNSSHIGLSGEKSPIFVVEHLSPANKALHSAARSAAKEKGYMYVWVRNGRIFMRKNDNSDFIMIKNQEIINNLK